MTAKEFNDWYSKHRGAYCFIHNIDHALDKAGDEAKRQMKCIGWSEHMKNTLDEAWKALEEKMRSMVEM